MSSLKLTQLFILFEIFFVITESIINHDGKAVLITGSDKGMGNQLAKVLNQIGFRVYATVLKTESPGSQDLKTNVTHPQNMVVLKLDVTNDNDVNEAYEIVKKDLAESKHKLWALVNNAGITTYFPLLWSTLDTYRQIFDVNVFGVLRMSRVFMPLLRASKGRIINMVSISGRVSLTSLGVYCMSKHALMSFTDVLRQEVRPFGVDVISIEPQSVATGMFSKEAQTPQFDRAWNQTSDEIKEIYGDISQERSAIMDSTGYLPMASPEQVVDDLIDSIVSHKPKVNYRNYNIQYQIIYLAATFTPTEFWDYAFNIYGKMGPFLSMLS